MEVESQSGIRIFSDSSNNLSKASKGRKSQNARLSEVSKSHMPFYELLESNDFGLKMRMEACEKTLSAVDTVIKDIHDSVTEDLHGKILECLTDFKENASSTLELQCACVSLGISGGDHTNFHKGLTEMLLQKKVCGNIVTLKAENCQNFQFLLKSLASQLLNNALSLPAMGLKMITDQWLSTSECVAVETSPRKRKSRPNKNDSSPSKKTKSVLNTCEDVEVVICLIENAESFNLSVLDSFLVDCYNNSVMRRSRLHIIPIFTVATDLGHPKHILPFSTLVRLTLVDFATPSAYNYLSHFLRSVVCSSSTFPMRLGSDVYEYLNTQFALNDFALESLVSSYKLCVVFFYLSNPLSHLCQPDFGTDSPLESVLKSFSGSLKLPGYGLIPKDDILSDITNFSLRYRRSLTVIKIVKVILQSLHAPNAANINITKLYSALMSKSDPNFSSSQNPINTAIRACRLASKTDLCRTMAVLRKLCCHYVGQDEDDIENRAPNMFGSPVHTSSAMKSHLDTTKSSASFAGDADRQRLARSNRDLDVLLELADFLDRHEDRVAQADEYEVDPETAVKQTEKSELMASVLDSMPKRTSFFRLQAEFRERISQQTVSSTTAYDRGKMNSFLAGATSQFAEEQPVQTYFEVARGRAINELETFLCGNAYFGFENRFTRQLPIKNEHLIKSAFSMDNLTDLARFLDVAPSQYFHHSLLKSKFAHTEPTGSSAHSLAAQLYELLQESVDAVQTDELRVSFGDIHSASKPHTAKSKEADALFDVSLQDLRLIGLVKTRKSDTQVVRL